MDHIVIYLIVAVFVGIQALIKKAKGAQKDFENQNPPPDRGLPGAPAPQLTEADRRYREIQDEIRRRVAQRQQQMPSPSTTPAPRRPMAMPTMGLPPRTPPQPISTYQRSEPVAVSTAPTPMAMPVAAISATDEAAATEAAAFALPDSVTGDTPIQARTRSAAANSLYAQLTSRASVRQAFVLREVLDRPLSLRQVYSGGHESWQ